MRFWLIVLCWVLGTALFAPPAEGGRVVFGVRVAMGQNSEMTSFIAIRYSADGFLREQKTFRQDDFIKVLSGFWPSSFNPERINYFEQENVPGGVLTDSITKKNYPYCPAMDSLWKLRFSDYPFRGGNESGWSLGMYKPSLKQEKFLSDRYHIAHMDIDYFIDTNFWVLLRDVSDSAWVLNYRSLQ